MSNEIHKISPIRLRRKGDFYGAAKYYLDLYEEAIKNRDEVAGAELLFQAAINLADFLKVSHPKEIVKSEDVIHKIAETLRIDRMSLRKPISRNSIILDQLDLVEEELKKVLKHKK